MKSLRRAAARFREAGSMPLPGTLWILSILLSLVMSAPLAAGGGERSRPSDSSDAGRTAVPRSEGGGGSAPSYSPPPPSSAGPGSSSGSGSEPRVAVPRSGSGDDSASRQRPRGGSDRGGDFRGGHGGHGSWFGGSYGYGHRYPSWYYYGPYWGWGSWWWDDWFWYGRAPYTYGNRDRYYDRYDTAGALDVDVSPGKTEVWIDGRYTGTADDFDGFPQYLWLDKGVYDLVLFRDGYKTIARQITIRPGAVMSIGDQMERGESTRPEDIATTTHERRDERIDYEERRREELSRRDRDRMEDWRDRARRRMEERDRDEDDEEMEEEAVEERAEERSEERAEDGSGRLRLDILPDDASVYLDGRFVGTGIDLQRLRNGLRLEPGQHRIAVVRPGHQAEEQEFTVAPGQEVDLEIELESMK